MIGVSSDGRRREVAAPDRHCGQVAADRFCGAAPAAAPGPTRQLGASLTGPSPPHLAPHTLHPRLTTLHSTSLRHDSGFGSYKIVFEILCLSKGRVGVDR